MSPEQEPRPKFYTIKDIAIAIGIDPENSGDVDRIRSRIYLAQANDLSIKTHHRGTGKDRNIKYFLKEDAHKLIQAVGGPIKTNSRRSYIARGIRKSIIPENQEENVSSPSKDAIQSIEEKERKAEQQRKQRLKRQTQREKEEKAQIIKEEMPIHFTNEVLSSILNNQLNNLSRSVHTVLDNARKKVDHGNNIPLAFVLGGAPIEDVKRYFIEEFAMILQAGFSTNKYPQSASQEVKELIYNCNNLRTLDYDSSRLITIACRHLDIPVDIK